MKTTFLFFILISLQLTASTQVNFADYFVDKTMRMDYSIAGDKTSQHLYFEQLKQEPYWGGSLKNLIDTLNRGDYFLKIFDDSTGNLIYSRGYSDLFFEWQDTEEAKLLPRSYYGSVVFPCPIRPFTIELSRRKYTTFFSPLFSHSFDPNHYSISKNAVPEYPVEDIILSGNPHQKIDIVILPEGYQSSEMEKFRKDADKFMKYFFSCEPFKSYKSSFNVHLIMAPSVNSGTDIPGRGVWKNTLLNSHFFTFDSDRYLTTRDVKSLRDLAACTAYDQIYVLVNSDYYGGGGIFNFYSLATSDHPESKQVFVHEFGHAFAALADEYAYEDTPVESLYNPAMETWHPNISNLVDLNSKWKDLIEEGTLVPTPVSKATVGKIGAFEGAGYVQKGMYRPAFDCRMRSNQTGNFCPVCEREIIRMIKFYTD